MMTDALNDNELYRNILNMQYQNYIQIKNDLYAISIDSCYRTRNIQSVCYSK